MFSSASLKRLLKFAIWKKWKIVPSSQFAKPGQSHSERSEESLRSLEVARRRDSSPKERVRNDEVLRVSANGPGGSNQAKTTPRYKSEIGSFRGKATKISRRSSEIIEQPLSRVLAYAQISPFNLLAITGERFMASPVRQFDAVEDQGRLLEIVRALVSELGHQSALPLVGPAAHLERELGLGSLERVELLVRVEKAFGARLDERVLADAETVQDLIDTLAGSPGAAASASAPRTATSAGISAKPSHEIAAGFPAAPTFQEVLRLRGREGAARTHLIFYEDEGESPVLTFGELLAGAERVAADLAKRGIGRGDCVALMLPTSRDFFLIFAGVLLAGATPVPIYPPFRADRIAEYAERQAAILVNAGARLLVTFKEAAAVAKMLKPRVASLEGVATAETLIASSVAAPLGTELHARADDLALLQYTSGSTGHPKGVMLTHANLLANVRAIGAALAVRSDDVGVSWLPLYHDMGLIGAWLMPLYFGIPVVVLSPLAFLSRPARWLRAIHQYRATLGGAPNFAYELAAAKISEEETQTLDLSCWRAALNGAEPVLPATLDRFAVRFAGCGFRREALLPVYGLAESSLAVTIPPLGRGPRVDRLERAAFAQAGRAVPAPAKNSDAGASDDDPDVISFVSVGVPLPGHEVRIANQRGEEADERVEGQLWFRGPSATQGYYRNEAATKALFPQTAAAGWVNSGDRAYRAGGDIFITGRVKDIIIHAGHNLYPHELEDGVTRVAGVRKGCVVAFGAPNPATGTERLVIVAESREKEVAGRARIAQAITAQVASMIGMPPDAVEVVAPNAIPKTSSGKLRRDATKQRFLSGTLGAGASPAWMQVARLAAGSSFGRIAAALRRAAHIAYGCYELVVFGVILFPAWLFVLTIPARKAAGWITTVTLRTYLKLVGWHVRVEGRELLRENTPRMFVSNHASFVDVLVLMAALGTDYHFVAKSEVGSMPFIGTFLRNLGHFSFDRENPEARLRQAQQIEQALREGESVFVFPEGTFTAQAGLRDFHLGAFKTAVATGRPIVPVALAGTRRALRDGTVLPRRGNITITICPAIVPQSGAPDWQEIVRLRDAARETIGRYAGEPLL
jgi:1-acyl-sn-glycerol-3-phosphate acyltransferase